MPVNEVPARNAGANPLGLVSGEYLQDRTVRG